jgi:Fe2+ transport system protein FeoA
VGEQVEVVSVDDDHARVQALRFGVCAGARVSCITKIPAGPVVIRHGRQEIAIGRGLASRICVRRCAECGGSVN